MKRLLAIALAGVLIGAAVLTSGRGLQPDGEGPQTAFAPALGMIHPRIAPDGKTVAVSYQGAIWTVPVAGGTLTRLTEGAGFDHDPAWSIDGKTIAFVRGPNQLGGELHLIDAGSGKEIALPKPIQARGTYNMHKLDFHPDGRRILGIFRSGGDDHGLAWYDLQSGEIKSLGVALSWASRHALSHDARFIAYSTTMDQPGQQGGNDGPQADLWEIPANGTGKPKKIARFPSRIYDICWHPAGKSLIVSSELGGAYNDLWHVPLNNPLGGMAKWTAGQADEDRPSISRDGKYLVYTDNAAGPTAVVVRDLANRKDRQLAVSKFDYRAPTGTLRLNVIDGSTKKRVSARIAVQEPKGKFSAPPGSLYRSLRGSSHFYTDQVAEWTLPAGKYRIAVARGPEYKPASLEIDVAANDTNTHAVVLNRWTHAAKNGWYSGENHIHANYGYGQWFNTPDTMLLQCAGEDLNVCNFMVANSDTDGIFDRPFFRGSPDPRSTAETILYWNQEFRSTVWGHMTLVNLKQVVEPVMTGFKDTTNPWDIPTNSDIADRTHWQKGHVNYTHAVQNAVKPFENPYAAKGLPIDVALGKIDSLDLNNSYAGTVPIWHRLLNCGFKLPPSAGTDCFLNRIFSQLPGSDRVYVRIDGGLTYEKWIDGLKKGRSFVSNGPMLEMTVDGQELGSVVKLAGKGKVQVNARAEAAFPLNKVEVLFNGEVAATLKLGDENREAIFDETIAIEKSGWLASRATGPGNPNGPIGGLFAHTAPIYVEVGGAPIRSRADAQFFVQWIDDLAVIVRGRDRVPNEEMRKHVQDQIEAARAVYARLAKD